METQMLDNTIKSNTNNTTISLGHIEWDDIYSLGYTEIDHDHRELFRAINTYIDAVKAGLLQGIIDTMLTKMADYAASHFEREEMLMRRTFYNGYHNHKICHDRFLDAVRNLREQNANGANVSIEIAYFLPIWLKDHVLNIDMNMGVYLRSYDASHQ